MCTVVHSWPLPQDMNIDFYSKLERKVGCLCVFKINTPNRIPNAAFFLQAAISAFLNTSFKKLIICLLVQKERRNKPSNLLTWCRLSFFVLSLCWSARRGCDECLSHCLSQRTVSAGLPSSPEGVTAHTTQPEAG